MKISNLKDVWQKQYRESQQRPWWFKLVSIVIVIFIVITVISILSPEGQKSFKEGKETGESIAKSSPTPSPTQTPSPTSSPTPTSNSSPSASPQVFDSSLGNNPVAVKYAQEFTDIADKVSSGAVVGIYLELSPEDMQGKTEDDYKQHVVSAFLTVQVTSAFWNSLDDPTRKDLVAAYVNSVKNIFSGFPHIYFKNNVRTVAEGEWSVFGGEPKITLK